MRGSEEEGDGLEEFGDLDGVEGGAFEELIACDPEGEAVIEGAIEAEAADLAEVFFGGVDGEGVDGAGGVVEELEAGGAGEGVAGIGEGDLAFEFGVDGDAVGAIDGDADAGDGGFEGGVVHDSAAFILHFHFLFGVASFEEGIDVGEDIESDLVGVDTFFDGESVGDGMDLGAEFFDGEGARAADGLVGGGEDASDAEFLVEGEEGEEGDGGGAIGIGDDPAMFFEIVAIDFWDDEGDIGIEAKGAGVIDDDRAGLDGERGEVFGDGGAGAEES